MSRPLQLLAVSRFEIPLLAHVAAFTAALVLTSGCTTSTADSGSSPIGRRALELRSSEAASGPPFLDVALDAAEGTAILTLPAPDESGVHATFLMVAGIETGLGANDVGLDRGQMGGARLVRFRTVGGRVLLEEVNTKFRAERGSELERAAAAQSFATSVLFGAEPEPGKGATRVDLSGLLVSDLHGISRTLARTDQGSYRLDQDRSGLDVARCAAFPENLEFASLLTFTSDKPGRLANATAPDGGALSFVQRVGFVALPDDRYVRRPFDPRMGAFAETFLDYGVGLDEPVAQRLAVRHRIEFDAETGAALPIVYYVDRAAPEPIRSALVEGASWWADAFADAGYPDLFQVEVAPEGLDPMDARYNVIQWVHRSTRGWSYGNAISDPRTGEIIKGHVSLGSLRVRQDRLLFEGLLGVGKTGTGDAEDPIELSLARIRQLSAHEVGHTLGLSHNFAASTADRASVMDYPAPRVGLKEDGSIDVSDAYDVGIGEWDRHAIGMLYTEIPTDQSASAFYETRCRSAFAEGLRYLTDADARSAGAAQPLANLWDDGSDPVQGLLQALNVRRVALSRFGRGNLAVGRALAELEEVFVPVYMHHRYQVDAALKAVAGVEYFHEMNVPGAAAAKPVSAATQTEALDVLLLTLAPDTLILPPGLADLMLPRPPGYGGSREVFERRAGAAFDRFGAAAVLARQTARGLMNGERLLRAELQAGRSTEHVDLDADGILARVFDSIGLGQGNEINSVGETTDLLSVVQAVVVEEAMGTYGSDGTARPVKEALRKRLLEVASDGWLDERHLDLRARVLALLERSAKPSDSRPDAGSVAAPPGSPIGSSAASGDLHPAGKRWASGRYFCGCGHH